MTAVQNAAAIIKLRAERRMGEMLKEMPKQTGGDAAKARSHDTTEFSKPAAPAPAPPPTLSDMGISKDLSSRCQKIASLPEDTFDAYIEEAVTGEKEVTTAGALLSTRTFTEALYIPVISHSTAVRDILSPLSATKSYHSVSAAFSATHQRRESPL